MRRHRSRGCKSRERADGSGEVSRCPLPPGVLVTRAFWTRARHRNGEKMPADIKKVVLAYSGGLDTSVILRWLQETYRCEIVTFTADLGQGEELEPARKKAEMMGVREIFIDDLREEFVRDFVFPMFRANALYEGQYLLGTSIARPLIAKRQIEIARADRRRCRRARRDRQGQRSGALRTELLRARAGHQNHRAVARMGSDLAHPPDRVRRQPPDPGRPRQARRRRRSRSMRTCCTSRPRARCSKTPGSSPRNMSIAAPSPRNRRPTGRSMSRSTLSAAIRSRSTAQALSPASLLTRLNELGGKHGIGRLDLVENRFVGMKSRGVYETPGGTILSCRRIAASRA